MMTKTTTKTKGLLLKLTVLPVIAIVACAFSTKVTVKNSTSTDEQLTVKDSTEYRKKRDAFYSNVRVVVNDEANGIFIDKKFEQLTEKQKSQYMFSVPDATPTAPKHVPASEFKKFGNRKNYFITIDDAPVDNAELKDKKPEDFANYILIIRAKESLTKERPQLFEYHLYTEDFIKQHVEQAPITHYPDSIFKLEITKVFKDGKVIAGKKPKKFVKIHAFDPYSDAGVVNYTDLNKVPQYPGSIAKLYSYVKENLDLPETAQKSISRYYATLIIEKNGTMSYVKLINNEDDATATAFANLLKKTEKWQPGEKNGNPVRSSYTIPFDVK